MPAPPRRRLPDCQGLRGRSGVPDASGAPVRRILRRGRPDRLCRFSNPFDGRRATAPSAGWPSGCWLEGGGECMRRTGAHAAAHCVVSCRGLRPPLRHCRGRYDIVVVGPPKAPGRAVGNWKPVTSGNRRAQLPTAGAGRRRGSLQLKSMRSAAPWRAAEASPASGTRRSQGLREYWRWRRGPRNGGGGGLEPPAITGAAPIRGMLERAPLGGQRGLWMRGDDAACADSRHDAAGGVRRAAGRPGREATSRPASALPFPRRAPLSGRPAASGVRRSYRLRRLEACCGAQWCAEAGAKACAARGGRSARHSNATGGPCIAVASATAPARQRKARGQSARRRQGGPAATIWSWPLRHYRHSAWRRRAEGHGPASASRRAGHRQHRPFAWGAPREAPSRPRWRAERGRAALMTGRGGACRRAQRLGMACGKMQASVHGQPRRGRQSQAGAAASQTRAPRRGLSSAAIRAWVAARASGGCGSQTRPELRCPAAGACTGAVPAARCDYGIVVVITTLS